MSNVARYTRTLRLALLPLLAVAGVAAFLLMRPRAASEVAPLDTTVDASAEIATAVAHEATSLNVAATSDTAVSPDVLAQALATWRDPFQAEAAELVSMQGRIKLKEKEIEVLKLTLEEKKLRDQLRGSGGEGPGAPVSSPPAVVPATTAPTGRVTVKALLCSESRRAALLTTGRTSAWVSEGESFGGMQVVRLDSETATLVTADGRRVVITMQH